MKKLNKRPLWLTFLVFCLVNVQIMANEANNEKKGILLVTFGTSYADAQVVFDNIDKQVKEAFPGVEVRWAYTSAIIRKKLKKQGQDIDSPAEALAKMGADGFTGIAVQSLHVIPGEEYENLKKTVDAFNHIPKSAGRVVLGGPLMYSHQDVDTVCSVIHSVISPLCSPGEAVVMMGHGTHHASNIYYPATQYYLWQRSPLYFLATVEGYPALGDVISYLKKQNVKKVKLMPFMTVAGDHAQNDMAGDDADSWKSLLTAEGYDVSVFQKGLAAFNPVVDVWIDHLRIAMQKLD